jgi:hypothetical protein
MKRFFLEKPDDSLDASLAERARRMYQPPVPAGEASHYWVSLERRIMSRINDPAFIAALEPAKWWTVLEGWTRAGLLAACVAVAVSAALIQNQALDENSAVYEYVSATAAPDALMPSVDLVTQREPNVQRDAVIDYVLAR